MSRPALIAWKRNAEWIASRTTLVAAERERQVADAAADLHARARRLDDPGRLDEVDAVVVVLLEAGGDRQDVRVEDDVERIEARLVDEQPVGALADLDLALHRVGLAALVERHDDDGGAVPAHQPGLVQEVVFAFLQADRVGDRLALDALEAGLDHRPLRAVDHDRQARDLRLGRDDVQERRHRRFRIEHPFVHVDVEDVGAAAHLVERDVGGLGELAAGNQPREPLGAGDVGPLADHDEVALGADGQRFEAGELGERVRDSWVGVGSGLGRRDVGSRVSAAAAARRSPRPTARM